jgi:hypothetical protein
MVITLDGQLGDSSQLTEHCRYLNGSWYSSPANLPASLKKYSSLWAGIDPGKIHVNPPAAVPVKPKKKPLTPQEEAVATVTAVTADGKPCVGC